MKKNTIILLCLTLGIVIPLFTSAKTNTKQPETWRTAIPEIDAMAYPPGFLDSIAASRGVTFPADLRTVPRTIAVGGETLVFKASWGPIDAGWGVITAQLDSAGKTYTVTVRALSNKGVSTFYKLRDHLSCTFDSAGIYPFTFQEHVREGSYKANRWIIFDHINGKAYTHNTKTPETPIPEFSQSVISILYAFRAQALNPGDTTIFDSFVQGKNYKVRIICSGTETIKHHGQSVECLTVDPILAGSDRNFRKKDKIRIWLTNDSLRMPLLIQMKLTFGVLSLEKIDPRD